MAGRGQEGGWDWIGCVAGTICAANVGTERKRSQDTPAVVTRMENVPCRFHTNGPVLFVRNYFQAIEYSVGQNGR